MKHKSQELMTESSYVESTYVPKPRYHQKRKSRKIVRWLAYITSDWRRLTNITLIAMLVSGLGTIAVLSLLDLKKSSRTAERATITQTATPDDSHFNAQNDHQSSMPAQQNPSKRAQSNASVERPILAEKKSNADRVRPRSKTQKDSRPAQSFKSSNVSAKSIRSIKGVGDDQTDRSGAKAPPNLYRVDSGKGHTLPSTQTIETQRPRRVTGTNDPLAPPATSGRNTKAKVIQWP